MWVNVFSQTSPTSNTYPFPKRDYFKGDKEKNVRITVMEMKPLPVSSIPPGDPGPLPHA